MRLRSVKTYFLTATPIVVIVLSIQISWVSAKVRGKCSNCHTMHQSQNGAVDDVRFPIDFGVTTTLPNPNLTKADCIGCHSSTDSETIKHIGETKIPIVYNLVEPTKTLAGGNFYWMTELGIDKVERDSKGHNVWGIYRTGELPATAQDDALIKAPGGMITCGGISCHESLALNPQNTVQIKDEKINGCEGCHTKVSHHMDDGCYRFLYAPHTTAQQRFVKGFEDPNWEHDVTVDVHNEYKGKSGGVALGEQNNNSISSFCGGCHLEFLQPSSIGTSSPWHRHPSNVLLPNSGEYAHYNDPNHTGVHRYNPIAPVSRPSVLTAPNNTVNPGQDIVMCLSCHRAHASPYPDMLRWDYEAMISGQSATDGCFTCHTQKDGS